MTEIKSTLSDFPKVQCPFERRLYKTNKDQWKQFGGPLKLKHPQAYLVTKKINSGFEWVFDDPDTVAVEKLDGTNIKLLTQGGRLIKLKFLITIPMAALANYLLKPMK